MIAATSDAVMTEIKRDRYEKSNDKTRRNLKNFWRENDRFASLFNTVVFGGKEVIKPEELSELDTDVSNVMELGEYKETLTRARDVVKRAAYGVDFVIMGIENQSRVHYGMPLRVMLMIHWDI